MKHPSLFRTSAVRLALKIALIYVVVLVVFSGVLMWSVNHHIDSDIVRQVEALYQELKLLPEADRPNRITQRIAAEQRQSADVHWFYILVSANNEPLAGNLNGWPNELDIQPNSPVQNRWLRDELIPDKAFDDDVYWPVVVGKFTNGSRLLLTRSVAATDLLQDINEYLLESIGAAVLLGLLMSISIAYSMLQRMDSIRAAASEIMAGNLTRRISVSGRGDEFDELASQLNAMLDRIQRLVRGLREVTDNIAHDLRSPLTRLRNQLEVTLLEQRSEADYRQALRSGIEEADELIKTFNALLSIEQTEAGNHREQWKAVNLTDITADLVDLYRPLADEHKLTLAWIGNAPAMVCGSRHLLAQAISNLIDNAVKYTPAGGVIAVTVELQKENVVVTVRDSGPGVPAAELEHVVDRFVRLDSSRNQPGNGLGLSLARAVGELHGGALKLENANRGGLVVTLTVPGVIMADGN